MNRLTGMALLAGIALTAGTLTVLLAKNTDSTTSTSTHPHAKVSKSTASTPLSNDASISVEKNPVARQGELRIRTLERPAIPSQPIREFFDETLAKAKNGDGEAAYVLAHALYRCNSVPTDANGQVAQIELLRKNSVAKGVAASHVEQFEKNLRATYTYCAGIDAQTAGRWHEFLELAADLGQLNAQIEYSHVKPPWEQTVSDWSNLSPAQEAQLNATRTKAMTYLSLAAQQGSVTAFNALGNAYQSGLWVPQDFVAAYANLRATSIAYQQAQLPDSSGAAIEQLRRTLRPNELEIAEQRALELISNPNCCAFDGPPDLRRGFW